MHMVVTQTAQPRETRRQRIERESFDRYLAANWPAMLAGNIVMFAKLDGKRWIYKPATPEAMADAIRAVRS